MKIYNKVLIKTMSFILYVQLQYEFGAFKLHPNLGNRCFLTQISFGGNSSIPERYTRTASRIIPTDMVHNFIYTDFIIPISAV